MANSALGEGCFGIDPGAYTGIGVTNRRFRLRICKKFTGSTHGHPRWSKSETAGEGLIQGRRHFNRDTGAITRPQKAGTRPLE